MNSLSYLTGSSQPSTPNEEARFPFSDGNLPNVSEEQEVEVDSNSSDAGSTRKDSRERLALIWRIVFFLPMWLIVKPISLMWFVLTFPLNLIEHTSSKDSHPYNKPALPNSQTKDLSSSHITETKSSVEPIEDDDLLGESLVLHEDSIKSSRPSTSRSSYTSTRLGKFLFPKKLIPQSILQTDRKKVLVLDLDETLIHSMSRSNSSSSASQGHMVEVKFSTSGVSTLYYVHKRPYCDLFLSRVSRWYDLVIFTASMKEYADPVIDWLEGGISARFKQRRYRSDCILRDGVGYVKDLSIISKNLQDMIIVDNSPISYAMNVDNAIQVEGWISDPSDTGLLNLLPLLEGLQFTTDTRNILSLKNGERAFM
ncbi:HGL061Wp [Eremothecium sinecaudum]|uniref:HGL061Wp n=1 Tax=Eremothecium sinecaudum TaxID=45286 RepID=A0A0X8HVJ6_9SACH|nr:HGL061Wp [Eremothecium sinecaudum]AMD22279.1 HGL061Wp [Eremothecium sinecaudum]